ncbi:MAG TPA: XRE family transcriptional regulator [Polyangiaceae bacterium]
MNVISSQQLGERLADARKRTKLTQAQVAEQVGVARTTLVAVEKGERRPSNDELMRLGRVLGIPIHDLLRESYVRTDLSPRFRLGGGNQNIPAIAEAVERLRVLAARYVELERLHGLRRAPAPLETVQTYRADLEGGRVLDPQLAGEDAARAIRAMLGLGDEPALGLEARFEAEAGLRIFFLDRLPGTVSAFLIWSDEVGACVAVNSAHPPEKRRWSLAHEMGHFLRDREAGDVLDDATPLKHPSEIFPETFTKEFLLPATGVQKRFAERCRAGKFTPIDLYGLAQTFEVSFEAMTRRLEELRLLPRGSYEKIVHSRLRPSELSKHHPKQESLAIPPLGLPERYIALAVSAYDQELLSEREFAEYLGTDVVSSRVVFSGRQRIPLEDGSQLPVDFAAADLRSA